MEKPHESILVDSLAKPQLTVSVNMCVNEPSDSSGPWFSLPGEASDIMRKGLVPDSNTLSRERS